jgi:hypothetical protein
MDMYSHDDRIMCRVFPSSLKDVASNWFYSLRPNSLHSFDEVTRAFVDQYISRKEIMKNSHTLLSIKMGGGESLKNYLLRFHNEMATIHNCSEEVAAAAFIGGLPPTHKFFEVLVEHGVTKMSEVVRRAQGLIQVEETKRSALNVANKSSNGGGDKEQKKGNSGGNPGKAQRQGGGQQQKQAQPYPNWNPNRPQWMETFTPLSMTINEVFRAIKDQLWVARPKPIVNVPTTGPRAAEYCSFHDGNGQRTANCRQLQRYLEDLVRQGHLKEFVLSK